MNGERLFRILGLVDEDLIEEAAAPAAAKRRAVPWKQMAAAACLALVVGCGWMFSWQADNGSTSMDGGSAAPTGEQGSGHDQGTTFMSYAGPVFPLTTAETDTALTAERTVTWDFAPDVRSNSGPVQWGAAVTDEYTLTNPTDADITVTALYPFAGSLSELGKLLPTVTVGGIETETALYAGSYAGGFRGAGVDDGSTWNLDNFTSWTDYRSLLEGGGYQASALDDFPELSESVIVYSFTDFEAPTDRYSAATQAITFTIDPSRTTILTYGFNGSSWDESTGWRQYDYFVPNGVRPETDVKVLVVLGDDIGDYTLAGYENGACETEIDGVSCTVTRTVTTLDAVLDQLCRAYAAEYGSSRTVEQENAFDTVPMALFQRTVADLLTRYGVLSGGSMTDRYSDGRLDDMIAESLNQDRVLYLSYPVTVPAGGSASVSLSLWKAPSFDFGCTGSENVGLQGYDLVTALGSTLDFTAQTAALANTDKIEIVRQNLGFDLGAGINMVALDPAQVYYYLETREKT